MATQVLRDAESVARFHAHWNKRIDQLATGMLGDEDFIGEMMGLDRDARESPWAVIAIMDRRVRRGQLGEELFRGIEARIAQREFAPEAELTVDLPAPPPRFVTQRIRQLSPEQFAADQSANDAPPDAAEAPEAPEAPVPVVSELAPGTVLSERYVIRTVVGEGGMARVYQALDRQRRDSSDVDWHVAIKVLRESTQDHAPALARLTREFETTRQLSHRNITRVFEQGHDGPFDFFTMEFLLGELLAKFLGRFHGEPLPRDEAWSMIRDIGSALTHAHAAGVVHGDLQPQNIMMLKSGELKLMDFGAGAAGDTNQVTPEYASLEQLAGLPPEPRDDLYALACLSYELLAGTHPYGHRRASEAQSLGLSPEMPRGITLAQWQLLQQALAFERAARPASVREWLEGLGLETAPVVAPPREPFEFERAQLPLVIQLDIPPPAETAAETKAANEAARAETPAEALVEPTIDLAPAAAEAMPAVATGAPVTPAPAREAPLRAEARPRAARRAPVRAIALSAIAFIVVIGAVVGYRQAASNRALPPVVTAPPLPQAAPLEQAPAAAPAAPSAPARSLARNVTHAVPAPPGGTVAVASKTYRIGAGAKFAEIKVTRTDASKPLSFTWWTEDGTALAGFDYLATPKSTAFIAAGARSVSLFVKIGGNSPRKQPVRFTVEIAHPSVGVLGESHATVTLDAGR